jgi:hypothetical protein
MLIGLAGALAVAGALNVPAQATGSIPDGPTRGARGTGKVAWQYIAFEGTAKGDSIDAGKKSNALHTRDALVDGSYTDDGGGFVYPKNYEPLLKDGSWNFSYRTGEIHGAGQTYWTLNAIVGDVASYDTLVALDPAHCPGIPNGAGWSTTDFKRTGSSCVIYDGAGHPFAGTDASDPDGVPGSGDEIAATSAWSKVVAQYGNTKVWSWVTAQDDATTIDRVSVPGSTISEFNLSGTNLVF